jgi:predicted nucleic acid-binding protein
VPEVISNTSPLQYLHQSSQLDLLLELYQHVIVPEAVAVELEDGRGRGASLPDPTALSWMTVRAVRNRALLPLAADLGKGEREVLAAAKESADALVLLDDALPRRYARLLGIRFTGTLGVLLEAKTSGHIDLVAPVLGKWAS